MKNKVRMRLIGSDGNAYSILGRFHRAARDAGWTPPEIKRVIRKAKSGDYYNLLRVMMEHIDDIGKEEVRS